MPRQYAYSLSKSEYKVILNFMDRDPREHEFEFEPDDEMVEAMMRNQFASSATVVKIDTSTRFLDSFRRRS